VTSVHTRLLIAACGHSEMARYGALTAWAQAGGHKDVVGLLQQTSRRKKST
jgi:ferritin-like metal-binding protein YciE